MASELKPCPFCGGEAYIRNSAGGWYVRCGNKKRYYLPLMHEGSPYYPACFLAHTKSYGYATKEEAIAAWNIREERTCKIVVESNERPGKTVFNQWYACSECGKPMNPGDNYCSNCGARVVGD